MVFPITVPLVAAEIKRLILKDTKPEAAEGYEVVQLKDLTWTKLWIEFKVSTV